MSTVRLKRLTADYQKLSDYVKRHPRLRMIQFDGDPPERYQLEFRIRSVRQVDGDLQKVSKHIVEIALPRNYPRTPPQCRMLSPVFHPNIAPHAICVGDHWSAGESLQSIVTRIGEMLAYQVYNVKSPLNGEAARWVQQHEDELPLDSVSLLVEDPEPEAEQINRTRHIMGKTVQARPRRSPLQQPAAAAPPAAPRREPLTERSSQTAAAVPPGVRPDAGTAAAQAAAAAQGQSGSDRIVVSCPSCSRRYKVSAKMIGRAAACQNCGTEFQLTAKES